MRRAALSEENEATSLGALMVFMSVLVALDIIYDVYIHFKVANAFDEHKHSRVTREYKVYFDLKQFCEMKLDTTIFLGISCILTWLNNKWSDFHTISLPISVFTFGYYAIFIAVFPSDVTSLGLLGLEDEAKQIFDENVTAELVNTVKTSPRIGVCLIFMLCTFNQFIQLKREADGTTTGVFFKSKDQ